MRHTTRRTDAVQEKSISKATGGKGNKTKDNGSRNNPARCEGYGDLSRCRGCTGCKDGTRKSGGKEGGEKDKVRNAANVSADILPNVSSEEVRQFDRVIEHGINKGEIHSTFRGKPVTMTYERTRSGGYANSRFNLERSLKWGSYPIAPPKRKKSGAGDEDVAEEADDKTYLDDPDYGYAYLYWDAEFECERTIIIKGIPKEVMDVLRETDHDDCLLQRYNEEETDYRAKNGMEDGTEDDFGNFHASPMDIYAHHAWSTKWIKSPEDQAIERICGCTGDDDEEEPLPLETLKEDFMPGDGKAANQKYALRMSFLHQAIEECVTKKQWPRFYGYYWRKLQQKQIAAEHGEKEKSISKSICDARKNISKWYQDRGFYVPDKKKLCAEKKAEEERRQKSIEEYNRQVRTQSEDSATYDTAATEEA